MLTVNDVSADTRVVTTKKRTLNFIKNETNEKMPLVSIIVLNWNGKIFLEKCFSSLQKVAYPNLEVIMVDNGSSDGSVEYVREKFPWVKVIQNAENLGCGRGFNTGMRHAKGAYLINLANDTYVEPDFVTELVKVFEKDPKIGACVSKILLPDHKTLDSAGDYLTTLGFLVHRGLSEKDEGQYNQIDEVFAGKGTAITFNARALENVGMFDPDFFVFFEDADLCWRLHLGGYKVIFVPKSIVYHLVGGALGTVNQATNDYRAFKNRIMSIIQNPGPLNLLKILPLHLGSCIGVAVFSAVKRKPDRALAIIRAMLWNLANLKHLWRKRKRIQSLIRKVRDENFMDQVITKVNFKSFYTLLSGYVVTWKRSFFTDWMNVDERSE